jgi:GT2 family glycosyltransferase
MKPIRLVCGTRFSLEDFARQSALGRSLSLFSYETPPELMLFDNNKLGLSTIYNQAIDHAKNSPAILIFVHDDVYLCDFFWIDRMREAVAKFDVVGLAGNRRRLPGQPSWFFADSTFRRDEPQFFSGVVGHGKGFPCGNISSYGPSGVECKLLDGLFLAADSERLNYAGVRFDEQFAFHFYDLDFCRQAELKGLTMGTWPMSVVHESGGAFGTPAWRETYARYLDKYGEQPSATGIAPFTTTLEPMLASGPA